MRRIEIALKILVPLTAFIYLCWFYREGIFDSTFLNRFGILLNFAAGFLVAPELIGASGMQKIETAIKNVAIILLGTFNFFARSEKMSRDQYYGMRILMIFIAAPVLLFVTSIAEHFFNTKDPMESGLVITLYLLISPAILLLLAACAPYLITSLKDRDTLRHTLVRWGVACFIFGNLFQFVSTF